MTDKATHPLPLSIGENREETEVEPSTRDAMVSDLTKRISKATRSALIILKHIMQSPEEQTRDRIAAAGKIIELQRMMNDTKGTEPPRHFRIKNAVIVNGDPKKKNNKATSNPDKGTGDGGEANRGERGAAIYMTLSSTPKPPPPRNGTTDEEE